MTDVITGLHAVTLHIRDVARARSFYRDILGLKEVSFDAVANRLVFALPGTSTFLTMHIQGPGEEGRDAGTVSGVVFRHPDPAAACREIVRRGGTVTVPAAAIPPKNFVRAVIADPDGNEFVLSNRVD
jgi:catechol 2,3-dioxygenase-like lactoylglutathione lyase family enzyme